MGIRVRFDKNGFYHPAYGRLGRGKNEGRVYVLPDQFGVMETIEVDIMDPSHKPPIPTGKKKTIKRYKHLPSSVEIIEDEVVEELKQRVDDGDEEAAEELEAIKKASAPKVALEEARQRVVGKGQLATAQDAQERTTGKRRKARSSAA